MTERNTSSERRSPKGQGDSMKGNEKLIAAILSVIVLAVLGAVGYNSEEFKAGFCGTSAPSVAIPLSPAPSGSPKQ
jgi:hypothetical protein